MKNKLFIGALTAAMAFGVSTGFAQIYVTGEVTTPNWSPGTGVPVGGGAAADMILHDDGLNGDATSADGVYTCSLTFAQAGLIPGQRYEWKAASAGFGPPNTPDSNGQFIAPASGNVIFYLDTNIRNDGYFPDKGTSPNGNGFVYTNLARAYVDGSTSIQVAGSFQSELGGTDFTPGGTGAIALTDAGNTTLNDGIYQGSVTGLPSGNYTFKVTHNGAYSAIAATAPAAADFGDVGWGGGDRSFTSLGAGNTITFTLNANTSRLKASNPAAVAGPPFYAQSTAWGTGYDGFTMLNANSVQTNTFQKSFNVITPGTYSVRVRQGAGRTFPDTGDYPFTTTTANQLVRVVFDRNTQSDAAYQPVTDIVSVLNHLTGAPLNSFSRVQPVGDWQVDFGAAGNYDANQAAMVALDDGVVGTSGDVTAGDNIFAVKLSAFATASGKNLKAVGTRSLGPEANGFSIQFGGPLDGFTVDGNNGQGAFAYVASTAYTFQVDTVTGRVGIGAAKPARGAYIGTGPAAVNDWSVF
ncbi:hypothetical protein BH09SUM1_BH09SUM1_03950 [soil metagenome]